MIAGAGPALLLLAAQLLSAAGTLAVVTWDERRLAPQLAERAWNDASRWSACVVFAVLAVPVHFLRTRRSLLGLALGVGWTVGLMLSLELLLQLVALLLESCGLPVD